MLREIQRRTALARAIALLVFASACAWLPGQIRSTHASNGYRIAGIVLNQATGEPAQRAVVDLLDEEDDHTITSVTTDAQGRFAFDGLPASKHPLSASKRGFRTVMYEDHEGYNTAIVTGPGQDTTHLIFWLTPGAMIQGVVTADGGDPVEGAKVMLFRKSGFQSQDDRILQLRTTTTDDTGAYEFGNLDDGDYFVAVSAKPWYATHSVGRTQSDLDVAYPVTYFDSTPEEASATPIALTKGARQEAQITLHAVPALHLAPDWTQSGPGRLPRLQLQQVVFGSTMPLENGGKINFFRGGTELNGVPPGHYEVTAGDPPHAVDFNAAESGQIEMDSAAGTLSVTGTLHMPRGVAGPDEAHVFLHPEDGAHRNMTAMVRNGRFRFDSVAPGIWSLTVEGDGATLPVLSVAAGVTGNEFAVRDRPINLDVLLSKGSGRIEGIVEKNGKGVGGVMVVLVPKQENALNALARRDQSDSDGSFSLNDAVPGQYTVVAIEDGWTLDWLKPGALARYLPSGQSVTVSEGIHMVHLAGPVAAQPR